MPKPIRTNSPRLIKLVGHGPAPTDKSVVLRFQDEHKQFKTVTIGMECAGQAFLALGEALGMLKGLLPDEEVDLPAMHAVAITPAMTEQHMALVLKLESGTELAVSMESTTHAKLLEQLQEAATKGIRKPTAN